MQQARSKPAGQEIIELQEGSLKTACSVSDALVLQYYEEADPIKAAFGYALSAEYWESIAEIKDVYGDVLFTAPLIAANVAHPLLEELEAELGAEGRRFSFLCGHDSNVGSVLAALGAEAYELPGAIEARIRSWWSATPPQPGGAPRSRF